MKNTLRRENLEVRFQKKGSSQGIWSGCGTTRGASLICSASLSPLSESAPIAKREQAPALQTLRAFLEPLKKFCGHLKLWRESGLFEFWRRFGSVAGRLGHARSPKPRQNSKILASNGHRISLIALALRFVAGFGIRYDELKAGESGGGECRFSEYGAGNLNSIRAPT